MVTAQTIAGVGFVRVEVPGGPARLYPANDVSCITLTTEERARALAEGCQSFPIHLVRRAVARYYSVAEDDLLGSGRGRILARPRQVAMHLGHELTGESLTAIGRAFGARHHTTALRAIATVRRAMAVDEQLRREVESVRACVMQEGETGEARPHTTPEPALGTPPAAEHRRRDGALLVEGETRPILAQGATAVLPRVQRTV